MWAGCKRGSKTHLSVHLPLPAWTTTLYLAFLLLGASLFAVNLRQPGHLQNPPLQSHLPGSKQDLLSENEEKSIRKQKRRAEAKGAGTFWRLKNKHRWHSLVHPQKQSQSLISNAQELAVVSWAVGWMQQISPSAAACKPGIQHCPFWMKYNLPLRQAFQKALR